ncbi:MAG: hypothetical protein A4E64_00859 [Syntrophorhabdus sp. PtaU1.Bin058]|nr:MAG: hypothetical protein A4E64_00859 [Syntrophorhabdus sp. PtaU1.Bin058]
MNTTIPIKNHAYLHPSFPYVEMMGGRSIPARKRPTPMPPETIPVASPLFFVTNHAAGSAMIGT